MAVPPETIEKIQNQWGKITLLDWKQISSTQSFWCEVHSYKDACGENPFAELAGFAITSGPVEMVSDDNSGDEDLDVFFVDLPPPDTLVLRHFPGFYCSEIVYDGVVFENATLELLADATDDAILGQLKRIRDALFPHWKLIVNVFMKGFSAKRMYENSPVLLGSLFTWLEGRRVDGINFELDGNALLGDDGAAVDVVAFFTSAYVDHSRGNLTLSAMLPRGAATLFHEDLPSMLDRIIIKTHGLLDESLGTTQLAAPLDYAGLTHRRAKHRTIIGLLEELGDKLSTKTCFTVALSGTAFKLREPLDVLFLGQGNISAIPDQYTVFEKAAKVLMHWRFLCVAAVDVDLDDVRGQCGRSYPLLRRIYETSSVLKYYF
ncbi:hypothetical protein HPB52_006877 [Rhipicephalus sanguineus]|uniref:Uncharacterized protein n=1 Tax=Rhipicephalus sanguineus TaxID=34632 RepID=A0A9D4Q507_RHISA|nr:hypothetical protein HPB52_006877 [Rhipicephalus sanguineus]